MFDSSMFVTTFLTQSVEGEEAPNKSNAQGRSSPSKSGCRGRAAGASKSCGNEPRKQFNSRKGFQPGGGNHMFLAQKPSLKTSDMGSKNIAGPSIGGAQKKTNKCDESVVRGVDKPVQKTESQSNKQACTVLSRTTDEQVKSGATAVSRGRSNNGKVKKTSERSHSLTAKKQGFQLSDNEMSEV